MPKDARVLFVESYPQDLAGQQRTLLSMLDRCPAKGILPVVATPGSGPFLEEIHARRLEHVALPYPLALAPYGGAIYRYGLGGKLKALTATACYVARIRRKLRELDLAGVYCNDMRGILTVAPAARLQGLPVMTWDKLDKRHGWLDVLQLPLVQVNAIISDAVVTKYPAWQVRRSGSKIVKVHNAIDVSRFDGAMAIRDRLGVGPADLVHAIVGSVTERKGQDRVLRVWPQFLERFPQSRLLIVGGPASAADAEFVRRLRSMQIAGVIWLGARADIPEIMRSIDVLLVPSRTEGMGRVNLEAMAAAKPVIGARTGGIPEVVLHGKTGLLFDGDDPGDLLASLLRMAQSAEMREAMGRAGRLRVEQHFNQNVQIGLIIALLRSMLSSSCLDVGTLAGSA